MRDLRAAQLLEHVVVTGGRDGGWDGGNSTDEVSVDLINQVTSLHVQVPQYEETAGTWSEIGRMKKARQFHAVMAVNVSLFCSNIVGQTTIVTTIVTTIITTIVYHLITTPTLSHSSSN